VFDSCVKYKLASGLQYQVIDAHCSVLPNSVTCWDQIRKSNGWYRW